MAAAISHIVGNLTRETHKFKAFGFNKYTYYLPTNICTKDNKIRTEIMFSLQMWTCFRDEKVSKSKPEGFLKPGSPHWGVSIKCRFKELRPTHPNFYLFLFFSVV